uniref:Putative secreted peptide n=1 Tax=Anopheles braziliensis TaxID=58242 RepID=A0A2M3ZUE2_9DIPT
MLYRSVGALAPLALRASTRPASLATPGSSITGRLHFRQVPLDRPHFLHQLAQHLHRPRSYRASLEGSV